MYLPVHVYDIVLRPIVLQAEAEVRRLKDAITQAQEEEREHAERAIQTLVVAFRPILSLF